MVPTLCCWSTNNSSTACFYQVTCLMCFAWSSLWMSFSCELSFLFQSSVQSEFSLRSYPTPGNRSDTIATHSWEDMETFRGALTSHTRIAWLISPSTTPSHIIGSIQIIVWTNNPNHSHIINVKYFRVSQQVNPGHLFITSCSHLKEQGQPQGGCLQELQMQRSQEIPVFVGYSRSYENTLRDLMFVVFVWW